MLTPYLTMTASVISLAVLPYNPPSLPHLKASNVTYKISPRFKLLLVWPNCSPSPNCSSELLTSKAASVSGIYSSGCLPRGLPLQAAPDADVSLWKQAVSSSSWRHCQRLVLPSW